MKDYYEKELSVGDCVLVTCTTNSSQFSCGVVTKIHPAKRYAGEKISVKLPYFDFRKKEVRDKIFVVSHRCHVAKINHFHFDSYVSYLNTQFDHLMLGK